jgi:hypothetical protein
MIFHPAILALYVSSVLIGFMVVYSSVYAFQVLRRWDLRSGSEAQLLLERKTYLISTLLTYLFAFELTSLFLYVFTVDRLHTFFVGAMCAAGSLKVNSYGYPALILKTANFLFAGLWLILNHADNLAYDYALIRKKYLLLLCLAPLIVLESILQAGYFLGLKPNIITSCCGSLFSAGENTLASDIASLPAFPMKVVFYLAIGITIGSGIYYIIRERGGYVFSTAAAVSFFVSILSVISFISIYYYELPTHHCPFCILQKEYHYIGYLLYVTLLGAAISGMGVGVLTPFRNISSLSKIIPPMQRRLALVSSILFFVFVILATYPLLFSDFILGG